MTARGYFGVSHSWSRPTSTPAHSAAEIPPAPAGVTYATKLWSWSGKDWRVVAGWTWTDPDDWPLADLIAQPPPVSYGVAYKWVELPQGGHAWVFDDEERND